MGAFLTIDEPRWMRGAGQFLLALRSGDLAQTYWHFHPGVTITWGEALILWLQSLWAANPTLESFVAAQMEHLNLSVGTMRLSGVILTSLAVPFAYIFAKPLTGQWAALAGAGLLAVDPFFVAHSRIINGDALAGIFMVISYLAFALLLIKPSLKFALISGVFVGLSFLTKMPSQILAPLLTLLAVIGYIGYREWRFWLRALALCGLTSLIVFVILWPAMWVAPVETLKTMVVDTFEVGDIGGKDKVEFFMGAIRERQSQLFYPLALLFRLTPVNLIGAAITLALVFFSKDSQIRRAVWLLWLFVIVVIVLANLSPKKADRYAMSVILAIDLLAGVGWGWLVGRISEWPRSVANGQRTKDKGRRTNSITQYAIRITHYVLRYQLSIINYQLSITLLIILQLFFVITGYPYILTYYNPLLGGYATAAELIPVGWGEGLEEAAAWINRQPDVATATVSPYYENVTNPYLVGKSLDWSKDGKKQVQADYVVFYIAQTQRKLPYAGLVDYFAAREPVHVIRQGQTPYIWIYKRETPLRQLAGEAEIVGRAQIVGYELSPPNLQTGDSTDITLHLLTFDQPLPANEDFKVSLVDGGGNNYGDWQSAATNAWTPNSVVEWRGRLSLPVGMLPGEYKLKVALVDNNTNSEVTHFPFEDEPIIINNN